MINFKLKVAEILANEVENMDKEQIYKMIEIPSDSKMGDYAFPCFRLAKEMRKSPQMIAEEIADKIADKGFEKVENVNAYVNIFINREIFMAEVIAEAVKEGSNYGTSKEGEGKVVVIDYSSPNIAKPFHIGHIRSTVIGHALCKLYRALGYTVEGVNHLGDYGTQFGKMIVAYRKWGNKEDVVNEPIKTLLGYYTKFHIEAEDDPTLEDEARATFTKLENGDREEVEIWKWFRDESLKEFNRVYDMLGITFESNAGESFYSDKMPRAVQMLEDANLLKDSGDVKIVDLEPYGMSPALIKKADGSTLYITRDIAAAIYRHEHYNFYKDIYVVASQQNLHFQQLFKILELMGFDWAKGCEHVPFGLVSLAEGAMSTRHGRVVFLEDVLNKAVEQTKEIIKEKNVNTENIDETAKIVGIGAVVFQELSNNRIKDYEFSWDKVLNFEGETGPYVQYTYARAASVLRKAGEEAVKKAENANSLDMSHIVSDAAFNLARLIYKYPEVIKEATDKNEPSILTRFIINVAQSFNKFYHDEHILCEDEGEKIAKIALVIAAKNTIKNGLGLLGIQTPEKM